MITTEGLLTSSAAFGITTATAVQRAACRIGDGLPLGDLRDHSDVLAALGGSEAIADLCSERGIAPVEICEVASPRTAKTIRAVASALRAIQSVDVSKVGPGEIPRVSIVSLKLDVADVPFKILIGTVEASPLLRPLLVSKTADTALFRHPSGKLIEIACVAGAKAGASLVARWSAGVLFDEATRMQGQEDGIVNLDDARSAVLDRLLPGAQVKYIGSPWAPSGPVFEMVQRHWGKPTAELVVIRTTGPTGNPSHWTPEFCARLLRQDLNAYRVGVLGEFVDAVSGLISPAVLKRNTRLSPLEIPPSECGQCSAGIDPSEAGDGNGFALCIVDGQRFETDSRQRGVRYRVVLAREWRGTGPDVALREAAECCRRYGLSTAHTDQYAGAANAALAARYGLTLEKESATNASNIESYTNLATLAATDALEFSPEQTLQRDIMGLRKRATAGGFRIELPRTTDGLRAGARDCPSVLDSARGDLLRGPAGDETHRRVPSPGRALGPVEVRMIHSPHLQPAREFALPEIAEGLLHPSERTQPRVHDATAAIPSAEASRSTQRTPGPGCLHLIQGSAGAYPLRGHMSGQKETTT